MLRIIKPCPIFVVSTNGKQTDYTLESGTLIKPTGRPARFGAYHVEVYAGKYEGLKGNLPTCFVAPDVMQLAYTG